MQSLLPPRSRSWPKALPAHPLVGFEEACPRPTMKERATTCHIRHAYAYIHAMTYTMTRQQEVKVTLT